MSARVCSEIGCPELVESGAGCPVHGCLCEAGCGKRPNRGGRWCSANCRRQTWRYYNRDRVRQRDRCRDRSTRQRKHVERICAGCGSVFQPGCSRSAKCEDCRRPLPVLAGVVYGGPCCDLPSRLVRTFLMGLCRECGDAFTVLDTGRSHVFCSEVCCRRNHRRRDRQHRRAKQREGDRVDLAVLAARDGWRCHLCGGKVTRRTWSVDHLIPLAADGPHTYDNVALAHHLCNSLRGTRGAAQLRLMA